MNCEFCSPTQDVFPHFAEGGKDRIDLVHLYETDRLIVKPDILPAGDFHALVVPKTHEYSFARNHGLGEEYGRLLYKIEQEVGEVAVFEHGGFQHGGKVQSVYHAHQHLIGTEGHDVISYMQDVAETEGVTMQYREDVDYSPAVNVRAWDLQDKGYFYIQQGSRALLAVDEEDEFPSQIAQRNMSRLLSGVELNWKLVDGSDFLKGQSIARISAIIDQCRK